MRVRSNPAPRASVVGLGVVGVYSALGDPITAGTESQGTQVSLLHRKYAGDNNGNDRLDSGDASIIMRFVTSLEPKRTWDTINNDLNRNNELDSGDIIRVLRAVVGLDPQPGAEIPAPQGAPLGRQAIRAAAAAGPVVSLVADKTDAKPGETVTVKLQVSGNAADISGASYTLSYPADALKLVNKDAHSAGDLVPASSATVLWNLLPAQNDYSAQTGVLRMGASAPSLWPGKNGELAEFTFQVQPGADARYRLPITVSQAELSSGYGFQPMTDATIALKGREAIPARFSAGAALDASGQFSFNLQGEPGAVYLIETSTDLANWATLDQASANSSGAVEVKDSDAGASGQRFYRATLVE
jgi:hypothetical protein